MNIGAPVPHSTSRRSYHAGFHTRPGRAMRSASFVVLVLAMFFALAVIGA